MVLTGVYRIKLMKKPLKNNKNGFTIIEILLAILISSVLLGAVFMVFSNQQKSYVTNDKITEMQQNLRAAIIIMAQDIREAGCDPSGKANAGVETATIGRFQITKDIAGHATKGSQSDEDTDDANENIALGFSNANDGNSNGIADGGAADWSTPANLGRDIGGGFQPIAENIEAVEFNYILIDDTTTTGPSTSQYNDIIAVQISILARASSPEQGFLNPLTYTTAAGNAWGPFNDSFRRRFVTTTIQCRNLGY